MSFEDLTLKDSSSIAAAAYARAHHLQAGRGTVVEGFLVAHPRVMYRMLQAQARRLRNANRWRS